MMKIDRKMRRVARIIVLEALVAQAQQALLRIYGPRARVTLDNGWSCAHAANVQRRYQPLV